jgi:signal-transduction protein with cAMP-binding, CBS, and nucleotidyltransferase domain
MASKIQSVVPQPRRSITIVRPDLSIKEATRIMVAENIGALVVSDENNILGILSERDIVRSIISKDLSPENTKVSDAMCSDITILDMSDSVEKAMEAMIITRRRHILAKEDDDILAILSIGDILFSLLEDKNHTIENLENYISN